METVGIIGSAVAEADEEPTPWAVRRCCGGGGGGSMEAVVMIVSAGAESDEEPTRLDVRRSRGSSSSSDGRAKSKLEGAPGGADASLAAATCLP